MLSARGLSHFLGESTPGIAMKRSPWFQFVGLARAAIREIHLSSLQLGDALYDFARFYWFARRPTKRDRARLRALVVSLYHVLEKGLAMPERKLIFGVEVASRLVNELQHWSRLGYGTDSQVYAALSALREYANSQNSTEIEGFLDGFRLALDDDPKKAIGGTLTFSSAELRKLGKGDFAQLTLARRSVRGYTSQPVSRELLTEAVKLAQRSPSVCNRQSTRVFWTNQRHEIDSVLGFQSGNRGFGHQAQALMIVTGDLYAFEGSQERNQVWVDGGMFAMSLLYALSFLGLGACALNWSVPAARDRKLRKNFLIPDSQNVIMMISVGHLRTENSITQSHRNAIEEVMFPLTTR